MEIQIFAPLSICKWQVQNTCEVVGYQDLVNALNSDSEGRFV